MPLTLMPPIILMMMLIMPSVLLTIMLLILNPFTFPFEIKTAITTSPPTPKNNKKSINLNTDVPDDDAPDADDDGADYPYSLRNFKNKKNNMTANTDAPNDYAPGATDDDASSWTLLSYIPLLNSKLTPSQCLNLKELKMTVTYSDSATDNSSPDAINTAPYATNYATAPDASVATTENKTSVRQLLDGQEYPVPKCDLIKKCFDRKSDVEQCVAYLHGLSQFWDVLGIPVT